MRTVLLLLCAGFLTGPLAAVEKDRDVISSHTNPPIILKRGNSLVWFQGVNPMSADYNVFDGNGKCVPAEQYLDEDFFGKATENPTLNERTRWHFQASGSGYRLRIDFGKKKSSANPNKIELCRLGDPEKCCKLKTAVRPGRIPHEFEGFDENELRYGYRRIRDEPPLEFQTCKHNDCKEADGEGHVDGEPEGK